MTSTPYHTVAPKFELATSELKKRSLCTMMEAGIVVLSLRDAHLLCHEGRSERSVDHAVSRVRAVSSRIKSAVL